MCFSARLHESWVPCRFKLPNIRQNIVFYLLGKASTTAAAQVPKFFVLGGTVLAGPTSITQANPAEPTQASPSAAVSPAFTSPVSRIGPCTQPVQGVMDCDGADLPLLALHQVLNPM